MLARFATLVAQAGTGSLAARGARAELNGLIRGFASGPRPSRAPSDGLQLKDFLGRSPDPQQVGCGATLSAADSRGQRTEQLLAQAAQQAALGATQQVTPGIRRVYIETYGCQMNLSDSEVLA